MTETEQDFLYKSIGKQIRGLRKRNRLSQKDLAGRLSLSRASVVNIEVGRQHPSLHLLIDLARIFKVSILDFLVEEFSDTSVEMTKLSQRKKELSKLTTGDSLKMVSDFLEKISSNKK